MQINWDILEASQYCRYKAWQLFHEQLTDTKNPELITGNFLHLPLKTITINHKILAAAWCLFQMQTTGKKIETVKLFTHSQSQFITIKPEKYLKQVHKLLAELQQITEQNEAPIFYRNSHCPECIFRNNCHKKLTERDCISLLGGMSANVLAKYHKKGITTITQLSHMFKPRRRMVKAVSSYLFELKALALREKKTYVIKRPDLKENAINIFIDFEGSPEENIEYLLGVIIKQENKTDEVFSFWSDNETAEENNFIQLVDLLNKYTGAPIYHYGNYEVSTLKRVAKKWKRKLENIIPGIEKRMVNLLSYLRTHVYPPTYGNGLKEVGNFLGFSWTDSEANGLLSIEWRKSWGTTGNNNWKEKLIQYNLDDCIALSKVYEWLLLLTLNPDVQENVQQISKLNRYSPYRLQRNDFAEDYQYVNKAAYFDYQRSKIYFRNKKSSGFIKPSKIHKGKGQPVWQPKGINEIIQIPRLEKCPHCGHEKLYHNTKYRTYLQTDLKFTSKGLKQWVVELHASGGKCARCRKKYNDAVLRRVQVGDNLLAWAVNVYVSYHISFSLLSRMLLEQFAIWTNPTYFNDRIYTWWDRFKPDVEYCWKIILNSPVIHIDETTVRLGKSQGSGYVWVFATTHTIYYHLTLNREAGFLHEWLKDYKGVIVTDFFPGYDSLPVKRQKCLIHLIRDLNDDLFKNPFDEDYKIMVVEFGSLLKKIIMTVDKYGLKQRHLKKHIKDIGLFYKKFVDVDYKSELATKYAKRFKRHWEETWEFLNHDDVPWNNNNAEVAIKAFAQHRRGVNGQFAESGLRPYLSMLTIAQTCRYREISFLNYLLGKVGIWSNIYPDNLPGFLPFVQARLFIRSKKFRGIGKLKEWEKSGKRPAFITDNPAWVYKDEGWRDWGDWIGV